MDFKKGFLYVLTIIIGLGFLGGVIWADTNGIWHLAEDVRGGVFGGDEQDVTGSYLFINPVSFNENVYLMKNVGIRTNTPQYELDIVGDVRWSGTLEGGTVPWARLTNIPSATTSQAGIVQLSSSTSSTSTTLAATPWAVKAAYDLAVSKAATGSCGTNQAIRIAGTSGVTCIDLPSGTGIGLTGDSNTSSGTISLDTSYTDNRYVNKAGDTMTGNLLFSGGTYVTTNNIIYTPGSIGIGELDGGYKLTVGGNMRLHNGMFSTGTIISSVPSDQYSGVFIGGNFLAAGNEILLSSTQKILLDSNVGIGVFDPTQKLDVNGKIRMRTQTSGHDAADIVATKGYVDSKGVMVTDCAWYTLNPCHAHGTTERICPANRPVVTGFKEAYIGSGCGGGIIPEMRCCALTVY